MALKFWILSANKSGLFSSLNLAILACMIVFYHCQFVIVIFSPFVDGSLPVHGLVNTGERKFSLDGFNNNLSHKNDIAINILEMFNSVVEQTHSPPASKSAYGVNLLQEGEENIGQFLYLEGIELERLNLIN